MAFQIQRGLCPKLFKASHHEGRVRNYCYTLTLTNREPTQVNIDTSGAQAVHRQLHKQLMVQRQWEADSRTGSQEIPAILQIPKVWYRVHNGPPLDRILSQINPVHNVSSYFLNIRLNRQSLYYRLADRKVMNEKNFLKLRDNFLKIIPKYADPVSQTDSRISPIQ
jgi:hypothetical protein